MSTQKQKNVFAELQKSSRTRGHGLSNPPTFSSDEESVIVGEDSEAVPSIPKPKRRTYRVSTYISDEAGGHLDQLVLLVKKIDGKKPKLAAVLERALENLIRQIGKPDDS